MATVRVRQRKDGSTYSQVRYRLDGVESSASFNDHAEALQFCDLATRLGPAKALDVWRVEQHHAAGMTVTQWVKHHIEHLTGATDRTRHDYRAYLRNDIERSSIGVLPLAALSRDDIARWVNAMAGSGKTIHNKLRFLAGALNAAVDAGRIPSNPCRGVGLPNAQRREIVFLTSEQFTLLRDSVTEPWRPLVEFLVASGCRWGEATALQPEDVDRDESTVRITRAWGYQAGVGYTIGPPKTRKSRRTINVPASVLDKLDYSDEWLFTNRAGGPVRSHGFTRRVWAPAVKRSGIEPPPRIHDLRHTCASWMIALGAPLPLIQDHLGHESIETTVGVYGHLDRENARAVAALIGEALSSPLG
jgi:integrase